jgi:hypothetical protein
MIQFLFRTLWRVLIFGGGAVAIYFTATQTFRYADTQLNVFVALLVVYCVIAYGVIPLLFRLYHVVFKHDHIPLYVTTADGWASDPVNIAIICKDKRQLIAAMSQAEWYEAEYGGIKNTIKEGVSIVFNTPYPEAPVSNLYLFNRKHDIAFQIPTNDKLSARSRHHVRFWRLEQPRPERHDHNHFDFWHGKLNKWLHLDNEIWIGACTEDTSPLGLRYRTGTITHRISSDADKERDFIIETLKKQKLVKSVHMSAPGEKIRFRGQQAHTSFISDGSIKVVTVK